MPQLSGQYLDQLNFAIIGYSISKFFRFCIGQSQPEYGMQEWESY
jgi:hypothetical protein